MAPFDLKCVGHGIKERFSQGLMQMGLLTAGGFDNGLIPAKMVLAGIPVLMTGDGSSWLG